MAYAIYSGGLLTKGADSYGRFTMAGAQAEASANITGAKVVAEARITSARERAADRRLREQQAAEDARNQARIEESQKIREAKQNQLDQLVQAKDPQGKPLVPTKDVQTLNRVSNLADANGIRDAATRSAAQYSTVGNKRNIMNQALKLLEQTLLALEDNDPISARAAMQRESAFRDKHPGFFDNLDADISSIKGDPESSTLARSLNKLTRSGTRAEYRSANRELADLGKQGSYGFFASRGLNEIDSRNFSAFASGSMPEGAAGAQLAAKYAAFKKSAARFADAGSSDPWADAAKQYEGAVKPVALDLRGFDTKDFGASADFSAEFDYAAPLLTDMRPGSATKLAQIVSDHIGYSAATDANGSQVKDANRFRADFRQAVDKLHAGGAAAQQAFGYLADSEAFKSAMGLGVPAAMGSLAGVAAQLPQIRSASAAAVPRVTTVVDGVPVTADSIHGLSVKLKYQASMGHAGVPETAEDAATLKYLQGIANVGLGFANGSVEAAYAPSLEALASDPNVSAEDARLAGAMSNATKNLNAGTDPRVRLQALLHKAQNDPSATSHMVIRDLYAEVAAFVDANPRFLEDNPEAGAALNNLFRSKAGSAHKSGLPAEEDLGWSPDLKNLPRSTMETWLAMLAGADPEIGMEGERGSKWNAPDFLRWVSEQTGEGVDHDATKEAAKGLWKSLTKIPLTRRGSMERSVFDKLDQRYGLVDYEDATTDLGGGRKVPSRNLISREAWDRGVHPVVSKSDLLRYGILKPKWVAGSGWEFVVDPEASMVSPGEQSVEHMQNVMGKDLDVSRLAGAAEGYARILGFSEADTGAAAATMDGIRNDSLVLIKASDRDKTRILKTAQSDYPLGGAVGSAEERGYQLAAVGRVLSRSDLITAGSLLSDPARAEALRRAQETGRAKAELQKLRVIEMQQKLVSGRVDAELSVRQAEARAKLDDAELRQREHDFIESRALMGSRVEQAKLDVKDTQSKIQERAVKLGTYVKDVQSQIRARDIGSENATRKTAAYEQYADARADLLRDEASQERRKALVQAGQLVMKERGVGAKQTSIELGTDMDMSHVNGFMQLIESLYPETGPQPAE